MPALVWVVVFSALLLLINLRTVENYARFEYWFALIKVSAILAFVVLGAALLLGGRVQPQYTTHGGFLPKGPIAPLLAMGFALYSFAGLEFVAVSTGESRSAQQIPRAIKLTFAILCSVYLGAIIVLVGVMPWNRAGVTESPFVTVFREARIPAASNIMTFVVLTAALSGSNAALYAASPSFVFHGSNRMGASGFGPPQRRQVTTPGFAGFLVRYFGGAGAGEVGAKRCFRLNPRRRAGGNDAVLAGLPGGSRQIPSAGWPSQLAALPMHSPLGAWVRRLGSC